MNYCTHYNQPTCVRAPLRPSAGICARCPAFIDSGNARVQLNTAATSKAALTTQPVPRDKWPLWAAAISKLATDADKGVGSTVDRLLGAGGKAYKATLKALGVPCGCAKRKAEWDVMYRY